ncbi:hypothetical protein [Prevotella sp. E13-27]|uniref:hypothetical protein n=1 Tax=Prevotella sp. E13-27 TaxID=2938122 RepID=UPI00200B9089|nr:hypothetical protein [Prevotella sp. E13-27]MCK8621529.1 hypothetical protein [Prevotella sp. E13-27]
MKSEEFLSVASLGESEQARAATAQLYADIIDLPHHVSKRHPQMSMWNRAAQFAPFAALTGYDDAIRSALITETDS